jgi:hypothetical protein
MDIVLKQRERGRSSHPVKASLTYAFTSELAPTCSSDKHSHIVINKYIFLFILPVSTLSVGITMAAEKRKASTSAYVQHVSSRAAKRSKEYKEDSPANHSGAGFDGNVSPNLDRRDTKADDTSKFGCGYHGMDCEVLEMPGSNNDTQNLSQSTIPQPHSKLLSMSRNSKQHLLDDQVSFIIITRDNNKPDPWSNQSTTNGHLSWPAVAEAYNNTFRVGQDPIGSAAMEKRARLHRKAWMAARPDYPRHIFYTKGALVCKKKPPQDVIHKTMECGILKSKTQNAKVRSKTVSANVKTNAMAKSLAAYSNERSTRVGGWVPPDEIRNRDSHSAPDTEVPTREPNEHEHTTVEVINVYGNYLGVTCIRTQDLVKSSALVAWKRRSIANIRLTLQYQSIAPVEMYARCVGSEKRVTLPDFDIQQIQGRDDETESWDFVALVDLYNIATAFHDSHVRGLVINQWKEMFEASIECELDADALNSLFCGTESADPARIFWASKLHSAGLAEAIISAEYYHYNLVAMLKKVMANGK